MSRLIPLWDGFHYFDHQIKGIEWMLEKERDGTDVPRRSGSGTVKVFGGLQCDDMGLGKTMQITAVMVNHPLDTTLLLAPLAMIQTWTEVCIRAGLLVFHVSPKGGCRWECVNSDESLMDVRPHFDDIRPEVYITNYQKLYTQPGTFQLGWDRMVMDEAHNIRNPEGEMAYWARKLHAPIRWAVTGTPLVNSLRDVVSLLAFLGVPHSPLWRWEPHLATALPDLVIHRSLDSLRSVIRDAPPHPIITELSLEFDSEEEEEFYYGVQGSTESMVKKYSRDQLSMAEAFKMLLRLRQLSVHPQIYINAKRREDRGYDRPNWFKSSTKMNAVADLIRKDEGDGEVHRYILFCQFTEEMMLFREFLLVEDLVKDENILQYDGSLSHAERTAVLEYSKTTTERTVLLLQIQAGGVGLNLQEYDRIIFISPWWTAALRNQAIARAVRMGQKKVVRVYHLKLAVEEDEDIIGIDQLVNGKAEEKQKMLDKLFAMCEKKEEEESEEKENKKK